MESTTASEKNFETERAARIVMRQLFSYVMTRTCAIFSLQPKGRARPMVGTRPPALLARRAVTLTLRQDTWFRILSETLLSFAGGLDALATSITFRANGWHSPDVSANNPRPSWVLGCPGSSRPLLGGVSNTEENNSHGEYPSTPRPRHCEARKRVGKDEGGNHHPRHREGKADRGRGRCSRQRQGARGRLASQARRQGRGSRSLRQVRWHRGQSRRRREADFARGRHPRSSREGTHVSRLQ